MKDVKNIDELDKWLAFGDDWRAIIAKQKNLEELNEKYKFTYLPLFEGKMDEDGNYEVKIPTLRRKRNDNRRKE